MSQAQRAGSLGWRRQQRPSAMPISLARMRQPVVDPVSVPVAACRRRRRKRRRRPPQRLRRQWPLRARAAAVAPPTNNYPERFAGPAQNLPAVPAQATTRPPKDARRTYLEGAQINHGSGPAPRPARRLRPLRIAAARHGEHRERVHAANIGTGGSRSRGNLRATPVMVIKADAGRPCSTRSSRRES